MKWNRVKPTEKLLKRYARPINLLDLMDEQEGLLTKPVNPPAEEELNNKPDANLRRRAEE